MSCDKQYTCPICGDRLIHQENRGIHESSSALGQYIHDNFPNVFWFMDIDAIVYKKMNKLLRILERKKGNGSLRPSQIFLLPILAVCIHILVCLNHLNKQSGVFLVRTDPPFDHASIQEIMPSIKFKFGTEIIMQNEELRKFFMAEELGIRERIADHV